MHIIQDLEVFLKHIEETIHTYFGNGRAAEEGKKAILIAIIAGSSPVIGSGTLIPVKSEKTTKEKEEPNIEEIENV